MPPTALILRTAGTNCDRETALAFEQAGAKTVSLHINRLLENPNLLHDHQILAIPGGFSYGDDINSGRIFANQISQHLSPLFHRFVESNKPIIGICNGFQVLVKTDLLPGPLAGHTGQTATLAHNDSHRFIDRWVHLSPRSNRCIWTQNLPESFELPIAHGEGKFIPAHENIRRALWDNNQVALVYADPNSRDATCGEQSRTTRRASSPPNPNGSVDDIAAICDTTGLIFGLMPHPERHISPLQHPAWTSHPKPLPSTAVGILFFQNAVNHTKTAVGAGL